ncbi:MAG: LysR family transcriptional regulator [Magnetovibrio sp.]|nr:LysR family transcriptional regulator [Magnetovibrio sp.]
MIINLSQLKSFAAVANEGSFTKAARTLGLTQSTLSMQVASLEKGYNVKLLERKRGAIKPTALGQVMLDVANRLFALQDDAAALVCDADNLGGGVLRVGSDSPATVLEFIATFAKLHPGVEVSLSLGSAEEALAGLMNCTTDIAVLSKTGSARKFEAVAVRKSGLACVVPQDHPLASRPLIGFDDLHKRALVLRQEGSQTRAVFDVACQEAQFVPRTGLEISSREGMLEAVRRGLGIGIIWEKEFNGDPRLKTVPLDVPATELTAYLVYQRERRKSWPHNSVIKAFYMHVMEACGATFE